MRRQTGIAEASNGRRRLSGIVAKKTPPERLWVLEERDARMIFMGERVMVLGAVILTIGMGAIVFLHGSPLYPLLLLVAPLGIVVEALGWRAAMVGWQRAEEHGRPSVKVGR